MISHSWKTYLKRQQIMICGWLIITSITASFLGWKCMTSTLGLWSSAASACIHPSFSSCITHWSVVGILNKVLQLLFQYPEYLYHSYVVYIVKYDMLWFPRGLIWPYGCRHGNEVYRSTNSEHWALLLATVPFLVIPVRVSKLWKVQILNIVPHWLWHFGKSYCS